MHHPVPDFVLRNTKDSLPDVPACPTLLQVLRKDLGLIGIKAACTDGDGSASNLARGEPQHGQSKCSALNACIHPIRKIGVRPQFSDAWSACFVAFDRIGIRPRIRCRLPAIGGWLTAGPSLARGLRGLFEATIGPMRRPPFFQIDPLPESPFK